MCGYRQGDVVASAPFRAKAQNGLLSEQLLVHPPGEGGAVGVLVRRTDLDLASALDRIDRGRAVECDLGGCGPRRGVVVFAAAGREEDHNECGNVSKVSFHGLFISVSETTDPGSPPAGGNPVRRDRSMSGCQNAAVKKTPAGKCV